MNEQVQSVESLDRTPNGTRRGSLVLLGLVIIGLLWLLRLMAPTSWLKAPLPPQPDLAERRRLAYDPHRDPKVGSVAPHLTLWTVHGKKVTLDDFRGRRVALLFVDSCAT